MLAKKKHKISKLATLVLIFLALVIGIYVLITRFDLVYDSSKVKLAVDKKVITLDPKENNYILTNKEQIVHITKDGVVAYTEDGQQIWSDTISLTHMIIKQKEPYFAIGEKMGRELIVFNDKGKKATITTQYPIVFFSLNQKGYTAVIENQKDSHIVSMYNEEGKSVGVKRITQLKEWGFPTAVEISPDNELLFIVYVNAQEPILTSTIVCIPTKKPKQETVDSILYGIEHKDSLVYAIQFMNQNEWIAIGDQMMGLYNKEGKLIWEKQDLKPSYIPYLNSMMELGGGYFPLILSDGMNLNAIHRKDVLIYLDSRGKEIFNKTFMQSVDYMYANKKGVIIGLGRDYYGFNKIGNQVFTYKATKDISRLMYLDKSNKIVAQSKDEVFILKPTKQE